MEEKWRKVLELGKALTSVDGTNPLLDRVLSVCMEMTSSDAGTLYTMRGRSLRFEIVRCLSHEKKYGRRIAPATETLPLNTESIAGFAALTGRVVRVRDAYNIPPSLPFSFNSDFDRENSYRTAAILAFPMRESDSEVIGVIQLINPEGGEYTDEDEEVVRFLSTIAASTIRMAGLKERILELSDIGIALSSVSDLEALLDMILREARNFTSSEGGSLYIKEGDSILFKVAQNDSPLLGERGKDHFLKGKNLPVSTGSIAGYCAMTGEVVNLKDVYNLKGDEPFTHDPSFDRETGYRTRSMLAIPLRDQEGEIVGVLQLINRLGRDGEVLAFEEGKDPLILSLASQAGVAIKNTLLLSEIKSLFKALVMYSAQAIDARSPHTRGHSERVSRFSMSIAKAIDEEREGPFRAIHFNEGDMEEIWTSSWLHDIGKLGVSSEILDKAKRLPGLRWEILKMRFDLIRKDILLGQAGGERPGKGLSGEEGAPSIEGILKELDECLRFLAEMNGRGYITEEEGARLERIRGYKYIPVEGEPIPLVTDEEYRSLSVRFGNLSREEREKMQTHVDQTRRILEKIPFRRNLHDVPLHASLHHEMLDGSGYPYGKRGEEIPLKARIISVADIFEALTAPDRPYKSPIPLEKAIRILQDEADKGRLDRDIVELFLRKRLYEGVGE